MTYSKKEGALMKRMISLLLAPMMCLFLCACGDVKESAQAQKSGPVEAEPILETAKTEKTEPAMIDMSKMSVQKGAGM